MKIKISGCNKSRNTRLSEQLPLSKKQRQSSTN
uniref:Uncharacterized protein n=1 Tax=Anguilla anguilla TaxID=7936 RepID=A0A0E9WIW3_ANGAN